MSFNLTINNQLIQSPLGSHDELRLNRRQKMHLRDALEELLPTYSELSELHGLIKTNIGPDSSKSQNPITELFEEYLDRDLSQTSMSILQSAVFPDGSIYQAFPKNIHETASPETIKSHIVSILHPLKRKALEDSSTQDLKRRKIDHQSAEGSRGLKRRPTEELDSEREAKRSKKDEFCKEDVNFEKDSINWILPRERVTQVLSFSVKDRVKQLSRLLAVSKLFNFLVKEIIKEENLWEYFARRDAIIPEKIPVKLSEAMTWEQYYKKDILSLEALDEIEKTSQGKLAWINLRWGGGERHFKIKDDMTVFHLRAMVERSSKDEIKKDQRIVPRSEKGIILAGKPLSDTLPIYQFYDRLQTVYFLYDPLRFQKEG